MPHLPVFFFLLFISPAFCDVDSDDVTFYLFGDNVANAALYDANLDIIDRTLPTVLLIHGWVADSNVSWVENLTAAYVATGDYNIVTVDWSPVANLSYIASAADVEAIGAYVADFILDLYYNHSADLSTFHVVGHSLGAHVAGFAGKAVQSSAGVNVGRITGLDPAGPLFILKSSEKKLSKTDADLVVVVHTDGGVSGLAASLGDLDFFPNGGTPLQPGCANADTSCSHMRATELFIESVYDPEGFVSRLCSGYLVYRLGLCNSAKSVTLGGNLTIDDSGNYYLTTNSESPYSKE